MTWLDVLRAALVGGGLFLWTFNRVILMEPEDRRKVRLTAIWGPVCLLTPLLLAFLLPYPITLNAIWTLFAAMVLWEVGRILQRQIGFTTTRSRVAPVPGMPQGVVTTHGLQVRTYHFADAPASLDGLVVAFVSDLHCDGNPHAGWYDKVWETVRGIGPDLLLLGGDYITEPSSLPFLERALENLRLQGFPLGAWAILGNHDLVAPEGVRQALRTAGCQLLEERWSIVTRPDGRQFTLHGTGAPFWSSDPVASLPPGGADISLMHSPDMALALEKAGCRYMLAGHLHGGQLALPLLGGLFAPSRYSRRWVYGNHKIDEAHLVVTAGLGSSIVPLRILVTPEIVVLRFHGC